MTGVDSWIQNFHLFVQKKAQALGQCEIEKGELEAALMLIGSKTLTLFPGDIKDTDQIPDVVVRLLEELALRRATVTTKASEDKNGSQM